MVPESLVKSINEVRTLFLEAVKLAAATASFQTLLHNSNELKNEWKGHVQDIVDSPRVTRTCTATFTCAFVGTSNAGKTTILREMFPQLAVDGRNWLVTRTTDTTSQALRIRCCKNPADLDTAVVRSWGMEEIKRLVSEAKAEHDKNDIAVTVEAGGVEVNGTDTQMDDRHQYKFGLCHLLRPLPASAFRLKSIRQDRINCLTVKLPWNEVKTDPMQFGDQTFHALQLRAVVKEVELRDPFDGLCALSGQPLEQIADLVFLDTPGLNTKESQFDEVLRFALFHKNKHIITELLRGDELDLIVHLVLAGQQSVFKGELWKKIEKESPGDLADLAERVIVAVNGMAKFLTDPNISKYWKQAGLTGDQFQDVVEANILATMSPVKPARICFLDSKSFVEGSQGPYKKFFADHRQEMERWTKPGGPGFDTLKRIGLLDSFRENVPALCDPDDRGQGFLVRQILDLIEKHGNRLMVRKYLVRSDLRRGIDRARQILLRYYDAATGSLDKWQVVQQVIRKYFPSISSDDLTSIQVFYEKHLKQQIDGKMNGFLPRPDGTLDPNVKWIAFKLTDQALTALRGDGVDDEVLAKLKPLKGKVYDNDEQFLTELARIAGAVAWQDVIMVHARQCVWVKTAYKQVCDVVYNTAISLAVWYRITQAVLTLLRNAGMSLVAARKLSALNGRTFESRHDIESELAKVLTAEEDTQWREALLENSRIPNDREDKRSQTLFTDYLNKQMKAWQKEWGYEKSDLPPPTPQTSASVDLLRLTLQLHAREMLYQLVTGAVNDPARNTLQDDRDRKQILLVLQKLDQAAQKAEQLCRNNGVPA